MNFQSDAKSKGFEQAAKLEKLDIVKSGEFSRQSLVPVIGLNDKVTKFAFKSKEGDISDVIETEKGFAVMKILAKNDTGYRQPDAELNAMIKSQLVTEKQGTALKAKLASLSSAAGGSLEAIVARDPSLKIFTSNEIRWRDGFIAGAGVDRQLVEAMAGMKLNKLSPPVKFAGGYALVLLTGRQLAPGVDVAAEKNRILPQLQKIKQEQLFSEYFGAVRKAAKIEDLRQ